MKAPPRRLPGKGGKDGESGGRSAVAQPGNRLGEILPGAGFEPLPEEIGAENGGLAKEGFEQRGPFSPEKGTRDDPVFPGDSFLVLAIAFRGGTQDGEIDVGDQPAIGGARRGVVAGVQNQRPDPFREFGSGARVLERLGRPVGASRLVFGGPEIVHRVMEPEGEGKRVRIFGAVLKFLQQREAMGDVVQRVIRPMGLGIGAGQGGEEPVPLRFRGGTEDSAPEGGPAVVQFLLNRDGTNPFILANSTHLQNIRYIFWVVAQIR